MATLSVHFIDLLTWELKGIYYIDLLTLEHGVSIIYTCQHGNKRVYISYRVVDVGTLWSMVHGLLNVGTL